MTIYWTNKRGVKEIREGCEGTEITVSIDYLITIH